MTVKELHTFTDAEIETITDALGVAAEHYRTIAGLTKVRHELRKMFEINAREASALQLKIEASK